MKRGPEDDGPTLFEVLAGAVLFCIVVPLVAGLLSAFAKGWQ